MYHHFQQLRKYGTVRAAFLRKLWRAFRIWIITIILSEFITVPVLLLINTNSQSDYGLSDVIPALYVFVYAFFYSLISIPLLVAYLYVDERLPSEIKKSLFRIISCGFIFCCVWLHGVIYQSDSVISMLSSWDAIDCVITILILFCFYASLYIHKKKLS